MDHRDTRCRARARACTRRGAGATLRTGPSRSTSQPRAFPDRLNDVSATAIDQLPLAVAMRESAWLFPAAGAVHLAGVALLVGAVAAFDLRVLGVNTRVPVDHLARHLLPLAVAALALIVPTGLAMFAAKASDLLASRLFTIKMGLLFAHLVNAVLFHTGPYRSCAAWQVGVPAPVAAKLCALTSLVGWLAVLACGRFLALE